MGEDLSALQIFKLDIASRQERGIRGNSNTELMTRTSDHEAQQARCRPGLHRPYPSALSPLATLTKMPKRVEFMILFQLQRGREKVAAESAQRPRQIIQQHKAIDDRPPALDVRKCSSCTGPRDEMACMVRVEWLCRAVGAARISGNLESTVSTSCLLGRHRRSAPAGSRRHSHSSALMDLPGRTAKCDPRLPGAYAARSGGIRSL